jgi:hypothetical protein
VAEGDWPCELRTKATVTRRLFPEFWPCATSAAPTSMLGHDLASLSNAPTCCDVARSSPGVELAV